MQANQQPGKLETNIEITIQTTMVQNLLKGHKRGPVGIVRFNRLITQVWQASANDDPYADLFFLKLYDMIVKTRQDIKNLLASYTEKLSLTDGVNINVAKSNEPLHLKLQFNNPYSYMVVYLIVEFEQLARLLLSLKYLGVVQNKEVNKTLSSTRYKLLQIMSKPVQWKPTSITRADLKQDTDDAKAVVKTLGEVDPRILNQEVMPPFVPR